MSTLSKADEETEEERFHRMTRRTLLIARMSTTLDHLSISFFPDGLLNRTPLRAWWPLLVISHAKKKELPQALLSSKIAED
jgi:hypothetical protein